MSARDAEVAVVKVGGSLYDLPDLGLRLRRWLDQLAIRCVVLVPGGGIIADAVRALDGWQQLGEETAHWLALGGLSLNARFLAHILPGSAIVPGPGDCPHVWQHRGTPILDVYAFAQAYENMPCALPHTWTVTSDSIAARAAEVFGAARVVLLKSVSLPADLSWVEAGQRGLVDPYFAKVVGRGTAQVQWINFRHG